MPGRVVGETTDVEGKRGFVLTLQTREQHIRREKATSNICTNEALCALGALIYMSLMGGEGIREVGEQCFLKSHYLGERLAQIPRIKIPFKKPFFKELVVEIDSPDRLIDRLLTRKIFGGIHLGRFDQRWNRYLLVAVTEKRTREEMDHFVESLKAIV
jgi:glycine dehydrogenase subunit 1